MKDLMRLLKTLFVVGVLSLSLNVVAQQPAPAKSKATANPATKSANSTSITSSAKKSEPADASLPTAATVDSFMKRMFGYNPAVTWKVLDISPSEIPGVASVLVTIGEQTQPNQFYVMPGGQFAMVGEVVPFGPDPFAPVRKKLATEARGPRLGTETAPVTVVEFSDLQCPHCKVAQPIIDKLIAESPDAKLIFQPFPLPMHRWAMKAAEYADCVAQQNPDAFWKFISSVYESQSEITDALAEEKFKGLVTAAGVDAAKATACSAQGSTYLRVQKSIDLGKEIGVNATPTLYINGRKVLNISTTPLDQLKSMINFEATQPAK
jgi:protein-disulfide isomerase